MQTQEAKKAKFHCIDCNADFNPPNFECFPGMKHQVESKRYYMADAPTVSEWRDGRPFINKGASRTLVLNIPPEKQIREGDNITRIPGGSVEFVRGMFETSDPEIQFYLDRKDGLCTQERWEQVYINDDERLQMKTMDLAAREVRLQERENDLLGMVKQQQSQGKQKSA